MGKLTQHGKYIVTAFVLAVGFSIPAKAQDAGLDGLFADLAAAGPEDHAGIAAQIAAQFEKSGSPAMDLLFRRGEDAMAAGDASVAVEHFTALVDHAPDFAEGYHGRASAYFNLGMLGPALDDLRQVLVLQPRHFEAMFGLAVIMEGLERPAEALAAYQAITEIYPLDPDALSAIDRLQVQLEGQTL